MNKYSLWQRFRARTPSFFRKAQLFGLTMAGVGKELCTVDYLPARFLQIAQGMVWVGGTLCVICQFAVEEQHLINPANQPPCTNSK